jgi:hypothetical protein
MKKRTPRFQNGKALISVIPEAHYADSLLHVLNLMQPRAICYVTLNRSAHALEKGLHRHRVSTDKIFFIDAVSRGLGKTEAKSNMLYVSSPEAFTELSIAISEVLKTKKFDALLFDSLSTLLIYEGSAHRAARFAASVIERTKNTGSLGVYTCLQSDAESALIKKSCMYVDDMFLVNARSTRSFRMASTGAVLLLGALFVSTLGMNSGFTGASVAVPSGTATPIVAGTLFVLGLIPASIVGYFMYKYKYFEAISPKTMNRLRAAKVNTQVLRKRFRKKIHSWLQRAVHLF